MYGRRPARRTSSYAPKQKKLVACTRFVAKILHPKTITTSSLQQSNLPRARGEINVSPYNAHDRPNSNKRDRFPLLDAKLGWCLMECPNVVMVLWFLLYRSDDACRKSAANIALLGMFVLHYVNRW